MEAAVQKHFTHESNLYVQLRKKDSVNLQKMLTGKILELGSGINIRSYKQGQDIVAVDLTPKFCQLCKQSYRDVQVINADAYHLPFKKDVFDSVLSVNLIHHLVGYTVKASQKNSEKAVCQVEYVLKPSGVWLISDMFAKNYFISSIMYYATLFFNRLGVEFRALDIRAGVVTFFTTPERMVKTLVLHNFRPKQIGCKKWSWLGVTLGTQQHLIFASKN